LQAADLPQTLDYMIHPIDAFPDAGDDSSEASVDQEGLSDDDFAALVVDLPVIEAPASADRDPEALLLRPPEKIGEGVSEHFPERPDDGTLEQAELVAWLEKLADTDDRAFTPRQQAAIKHEIKELREDVKRLQELNRHQLEAIDKRLTEIQCGSETMGRKDWLTLAIGAAVSLVIMESVPPLMLLPLVVKGFHALGDLLILDA